MADEKLGRRYATAVFSLANERNAVDGVGNDLATIASALGTGLAHEFSLRPSSTAAKKSACCWKPSDRASTNWPFTRCCCWSANAAKPS